MVLENAPIQTIEQARLDWMSKIDIYYEADFAVREAWSLLEHLKTQAEYKRVWDSYEENINA